MQKFPWTRDAETAQNKRYANEYSERLKKQKLSCVTQLNKNDVKWQESMDEITANARSNITKSAIVEKKLSAAERRLDLLCKTLAGSSVVEDSENDLCGSAQSTAEALMLARQQLSEMSGKNDVNDVVLWARTNASNVKNLTTLVQTLKADARMANAEKTQLEEMTKKLRLQHADILQRLATQEKECLTKETAAKTAHLAAVENLKNQVVRLGEEARTAASEKKLLEDKMMAMALDYNAAREEYSDKLKKCLQEKSGNEAQLGAMETPEQQNIKFSLEAVDAQTRINELGTDVTEMRVQYLTKLESLATQLQECLASNLRNTQSRDTLRDELTGQVESLNGELEKCRNVEKQKLKQKVEDCLAKFKVQSEQAAAKAREAEEMAKNNELLQEQLKTLKINLDTAKATRSTLEQKIDTLISEKLVDEHDKKSLASNMMQAAQCRAALNQCLMDTGEMVEELSKWRNAFRLSPDAITDDPEAIVMDVLGKFTEDLQMNVKTSSAKVRQLEAQILKYEEEVRYLKAKIKQIKQSRE